MGIKFYCPNGHKLNVKAFLAGKKAICPKCGVKVVVPVDLTATESDRILVDPEELGELATAQMSGIGRMNSATESPNATGNSAVHPAPGPLAAAAVDAAVSAVARLANGPAANGPTAPGPAAPDPIDEAPSAVWYVRPPSGGQFGPAGGETMRGWLKEGRVTGDTLVWRAGWPEWRMASAAFPQQMSSGADETVPPAPPALAPVARPVAAAVQVAPMAAGFAPVAPVMPVGQLPSGQLPSGQLPGAPLGLGQLPAAPLDSLTEDLYEGAYRRKRRRRSQDVTKIVTGVLIVLTIILVIILAIVFGQHAESQKTSALKTSALKVLHGPLAQPEMPAVVAVGARG